jgi:hypothetical protein
MSYERRATEGRAVPQRGETSERTLVRVLRSQIAMTAASSCYDHATPSMARR